MLILSPIGVIGGGWLSDILFRRGYKDAPLRVAIMAALLMVPVSLVATRFTDPTLALAIMAPFAFGASISMGLAPAALQLVTPNRLRAQIGAAWMLFLNLITASVGPWAVGWISDSVYADPMRIGEAITIVNVASVAVGGVILLLTLKPFREAVEKQNVI